METEKLDNIRHSTAHLMAAAVTKLWPNTLPTIGPVIEDGFYYDFDNLKISEEDLPKIEEEMRKFLPSWEKFERLEVTTDEAKEKFKDNPYKLELIEELVKNNEKITLYKSGDFVDLCRGGHSVKPKEELQYFKLLSIAGAYWRGDEKNKMLTRIYGTAFPTQKELDKHIQMLEEAKKRDHRILNQTLNLYFISDELGRGLVTLLPNGAIIAEELEKWAKETEAKWGYVRVLTPHIATERLFKISGHVPYYLASMYPPMKMEEKGEGETDVYYIKPMNCAAHHLVFKSQTRSYRDLPLRIAEYGAVYRYEKSGELHGMMRVRGPIHQNDSHIFCTEEQSEEEFQKVMDLHMYYYQTLGLTKKDFFLSFATRDKNDKDKYLGEDSIWEKAESITLKYIKNTKIPYQIEDGGAAFYGPKIDFNIKTVTGKVFAASTNQLDFFLPRAFGLKYIDKDGQEKTPVCIHRAPLGAHVRFIAFLTEHFAGAFPVWLSPVQVKVLPITERSLDYAKEVVAKLKDAELRAGFDDRNETLPAKIRDAQLAKIPYMVIIGDKEEKAKKISLRDRKGKDHGQIELTKFIDKIKKEIEEKTIN